MHRQFRGQGLQSELEPPASSLQLISISGRTEPAEGPSTCLQEPRSLQTLACALERGTWAAASCTGTSDCILKVLYQDFLFFFFFLTRLFFFFHLKAISSSVLHQQRGRQPGNLNLEASVRWFWLCASSGFSAETLLELKWPFGHNQGNKPQ